MFVLPMHGLLPSFGRHSEMTALSLTEARTVLVAASQTEAGHTQPRSLDLSLGVRHYTKR